jgi:hypothetical protein
MDMTPKNQSIVQPERRNKLSKFKRVRISIHPRPIWSLRLVPLPESRTLRPRSFSGPLLNTAVKLDVHCPNFVSFVLCTSTLRRQAIFATLAALDRDHPESLAARLKSLFPTDHHSCRSLHQQIARVLMMAPVRAREIIRAVYGEAPDGLLGVLNRIGDDPLPDPRLYFTLFDTFTDPQHRVRRDVLRHRRGPITALHIRTVHRLDPVLVHEHILTRVHSVSQAEDVNAALALIRRTVSSATEEAIRQSIQNIGDKTDLATFLNRWLQKVDCPPAFPLIPENDPDIVVMTSGDDIAALGRRYRNCSATRIIHAAIGYEALLEWKPSPGLVAQCRRLTSGQWVLTDVHAKGNGRVQPTAAAAFRRKLEALGIPALSPGDMFPRASGVLSMLGVWHGLGNNLGFEDDDDLDEGDEIAEVGHAA